MNICKHCGFTGESEDFVNPRGKVCEKCHKKQQKKRNDEYRKNNKEKIPENNREYYQINRKQILEKTKKQRRRNGMLPWSEIKHLRLGLYIEQTIAAMFGVSTEVFSNKAVDFICPGGYKIQVKAASLTNTEHPRWSFQIEKNKVADYFILVAVNNANDIDKEDFRPTHIWMMKGNVLSNKVGTTISLSRVSKWNKYSIMEKYENKFVACCNIIKENEPKDK